MRMNTGPVTKTVIDRIESYTEKRCYDGIPENLEPPYYHIELSDIQPAPTKNMDGELYVYIIHVLAPNRGNGSSIELLGMIDDLKKALEEDLPIPMLWFQKCEGIMNLNNEETDDKHAILQFSMRFQYANTK